MPIWRWTVGDCTKDGIECLELSIKTAKRCYGPKSFDWYVCSNAELCQSHIESVCLRQKVHLIRQSWHDLPLPPEAVPGLFDIHAKAGLPVGRQGSFWKMCPPRLDITQHEVVSDNDIIFRKPFPQIESFLSCQKPLVVTENVFCHGKFHDSPIAINSGLFGLPPLLDFGLHISKKWIDYGKPHGLLFRDEQGLIASVLASFDPIVVNDMVYLLPEGSPIRATYAYVKECGANSKVIEQMLFDKHTFSNKDASYHLLSLNRADNPWYAVIKKHLTLL